MEPIGGFDYYGCALAVAQGNVHYLGLQDIGKANIDDVKAQYVVFLSDFQRAVGSVSLLESMLAAHTKPVSRLFATASAFTGDTMAMPLLALKYGTPNVYKDIVAGLNLPEPGRLTRLAEGIETVMLSEANARLFMEKGRQVLSSGSYVLLSA